MDKTTSSLAWTPALNGIRSRLGGSIRTRWPTPFPACSISYSARARNPSGSKPGTNLVWIIELHRVFPERWVTLQQVYRCAIDPELFAAKIEEAEKLSDDLNTGTVFMTKDTYEAQVINLTEWNWVDAPETQDDVQAVYTRPMKEKLDKLKITHQIVWEPGPGEDTRERVEAVKRWFVHDWQTLDNKIRSSIVEGVQCSLPCSTCRTWRRCFVPSRRLSLTIPKPSSCKPN